METNYRGLLSNLHDIRHAPLSTLIPTVVYSLFLISHWIIKHSGSFATSWHKQPLKDFNDGFDASRSSYGGMSWI